MKVNIKRTSIALIAMLLLSGCGRGKRPNVLIITMDTTRADRLGCYGYLKGDTSNLDCLASEGALFENAQAVMPITLPTHATIFTGYLPIEHGLRLNRECRLADNVPTMAESFKAAGYKTAAIVATGILNAKFGLNKGFELYSDNESVMAQEIVSSPPRPAEKISSLAIEWLRSVLDNNKSDPFMMWVHYYDPHIPRKPHPQLRGLKSSDPYDVEISYMDRHIGRIFDCLRDKGVMDETLVIALADHGESLGEHGELLHGCYIYQGTQHIPLLFRWPEKIPAGLRVSGTVSQTDILPTVLELTGVKMPLRATGVSAPLMSHSFAGAVRGKEKLDQRLCHMEELWTYQRFGWAPLAGLVEGEWSYIRAPESELYDLREDPGQTNNLAKDNARKLDEMAMELEQIEQSVKEFEASSVTISEAEARRFASLGYMAGRSDTVGDLKKEKDFLALTDPKEKSHVIAAYNRQGQSVKPRHLDYLSDEILDDAVLLANEFPDKPEFLVQAGMVYLSRKNQEDAFKMFYRAERFAPTNSVVLITLGNLYGKRNDFNKMVECYQRAAVLRPDDFQIQHDYDQVLIKAFTMSDAVDDQQRAKDIYYILKKRGSSDPSVQALLKKHQGRW